MQSNPNVSIEQPLQTLYFHWTKAQGPITNLSKKPKQLTQRKKMKQQMTKFKDARDADKTTYAKNNGK